MMKNLNEHTKLYGLLCAVSFIFLISNPVATASVSVKNLYVIDHEQVSAQPFPPTSSASSLKPVSLSGFVNQTIENLFLSQGVVQGQQITVYQFKEVREKGVVSITGAVGSSSSSYILVTFTPKSKDLQLGDGFVVNYASSLGKQIRGLSRGIDRVAETYAKSDDPSVRLLGSYYRIVADSLQRLRELLPEGVQHLRVSGTEALVLDYNFWGCLAAIAGLIAAAAAFIAACVTPAVIAVLPCVAATFALLSATFAVIQECN